MGELLVKFGVGEDMDPGCQGVQWISELGLEGDTSGMSKCPLSVRNWSCCGERIPR